ncbi:MAG: hypothetical protein ABNH19_06110, partial [Dokdonia sp.]
MIKTTSFGGTTKYVLLLFLLFTSLAQAQTVTKTWNDPGSVSVDGNGVYALALPAVSFTGADFATGSVISDINVTIVWAKTDGTCTAPGTGNSFHGETSMRLDGPSVQEPLVPPGTYTGTASIPAVTTTFDQAAGVAPSGTPASGTFLPAGGNLDNFNGSTALGNFTVSVGDNGAGDPLCIDSYQITITAVPGVDTTPPVITCPADTTVECDASTDPVDTGSATATDDTDPSPVITFVDAVVAGTGNNSVITRTWTATDANGNASNCDQIITVVDTTAPVITCPADTTVECDASTDPADTGSATAVDNCDGMPVITFVDAVVAGTGNNSVITRTWTATDANGNASNCDQIITVVDTTAPVITCPADTTV